MVYKWRIPGIVPVDAQTAGEELERIYKRDGIITPEKVLEDNTETGTPLHDCFEWDDTTAAHKYRVKQAKEIIQTIVSVSDSAPQLPPVITGWFTMKNSAAGYALIPKVRPVLSPVTAVLLPWMRMQMRKMPKIIFRDSCRPVSVAFLKVE